MSNSLKSIEAKIKKYVSKDIECSEWHSSIILEGIVERWEDVIRAGSIAANKGYKGVVNKITVRDLDIPEIKRPIINDDKLEGKKVDILIIGGGIIGSAIARELSKWNISILLVDKEDDIAMHASSRNDGMIHPGIEPKPGSKKAFFNVKGNEMYTKVSKELDVPFRRSGSTILIHNKWLKIAKPLIMKRAKQNKVPGVSIISKEEIRKIEPYATSEAEFAIHFASTGVIPPYKMAVAYAENAVMNGAEISLNTIVTKINKKENNIVSVETNRGTVYPKVVVNAAGVFADKIADMVGDQFFTIHPRKGEIVFLDKKKGCYINSIMAMPSISLAKGHTKGGGVVKTLEGNILIGPDAYEQPYREDFSTHKENIDAILKKQLKVLPQLSKNDLITYCAGIRAATYEEDFIIEKSEYVNNLVYAAGIQSPGFASAPAIAQEIEYMTCSILKSIMDVNKKENWNPMRVGILNLKDMSFEERSKIIKGRPDYGIIVCRCEEISKGEIIDAINSPIPALTVDAIKRRTRVGMGRCQGGFCTPNLMNIINEESGIDMLSITKKGNDSYMLAGETKSDN